MSLTPGDGPGLADEEGTQGRCVAFIEEPPGMDRRFRVLSRLKSASPKSWADAYLAAFAGTAQLTLVTFDRAFRGRARPMILLET